MAEVPHGQDIGARSASSRISAAIVDASTKRLFGFANAVFDAVLCNDNRSAVTVSLPARGNTYSVSRNRGRNSSSNARSASIPQPSPVSDIAQPAPDPGRRAAPAAATRPTRAFGERSRAPSCPPPVRRRTAVAAADLHLGGQVLFGAARHLLFGCQVCSPPFFRLVHSSRSGFGRHRRASDDSGPPTGLERFVLPGPYELAIFARSSA
jgi:hypothetical protein